MRVTPLTLTLLNLLPTFYKRGVGGFFLYLGARHNKKGKKLGGTGVLGSPRRRNRLMEGF